MHDMTGDLSELRRGVLQSCVLAMLAQRPRFGLELVRDLSAANQLVTSHGTIYPLLTRLQSGGLVTSYWEPAEKQRPRRFYAVTDEGLHALARFQKAWSHFRDTVDDVLSSAPTLPVHPM